MCVCVCVRLLAWFLLRKPVSGFVLVFVVFCCVCFVFVLGGIGYGCFGNVFLFVLRYLLLLV